MVEVKKMGSIRLLTLPAVPVYTMARVPGVNPTRVAAR